MWKVSTCTLARKRYTFVAVNNLMPVEQKWCGKGSTGNTYYLAIKESITKNYLMVGKMHILGLDRLQQGLRYIATFVDFWKYVICVK